MSGACRLPSASGRVTPPAGVIQFRRLSLSFACVFVCVCHQAVS